MEVLWLYTNKIINVNKSLFTKNLWVDNQQRWLQIRQYFCVNREYRGKNSTEYQEPYELGKLPHLQYHWRKKWLHNIVNIQSSVILHHIYEPIMAMLAWETLKNLVSVTLKETERHALLVLDVEKI